MKFWGRVKVSAYAAYAGWKGMSFDFSPWRGRTFWGVDNSQLSTNETIFSVITRLSNAVSSLPFKLYQNYDVVTDNNLADLLIEPNKNMAGWELLNKLEVSRNEHGNAYAAILRDHYMQPTELLPLDNMQVTPQMDRDSGDVWYKVQAHTGTVYVHNLNMIHVKHVTGVNRIEGVSPIKVLKNALQYDKAVQEFSLSEMEKKESFKLSYGANVSPDKQKQVIETFKQFYDENGGILFQEPGVTIDQMQKNYNATDTASSEKITRTRIANVFNFPLAFLNEQGGSLSSNEQTMTQFVQLTLSPILRQYEQEFNRKMLTKEQRRQGFYYKFSVNGLLRGDTAARTAFYQMMLRTAAMTPNEVRQLEDLPPDKSSQASELWISGDLYPLNTPISERNSTVPAGGGEKVE